MDNIQIKRTVGLALQGGGSHTAFTWGVLDRLLEEVQRGALAISAVSGTSGGALNAAVLVYGLLTSPEEARRLLAKLWSGVSARALWPVDPSRMWLSENSAARWNVDWTPTAIGLGIGQQIYSPYYLGPLYTNPLDAVIRTVITDFNVLNHPPANTPRLFVCATNVNTTARRIFEQREITVDALLASSCEPNMFKAIEIDGSFYWDGGYLGNPALNPLVDNSDDILTVSINPLNREGGPPMTPREIVNRINEVSYNASWVMELRQMMLINQLLDSNELKPGKYKKKRFHVIRDEKFMEEIGVASKQNASPDFIDALFERGRATADAWVLDNLAKIGVETTFDIDGEVAARLKGRGVEAGATAPGPTATAPPPTGKSKRARLEERSPQV